MSLTLTEKTTAGKEKMFRHTFGASLRSWLTTWEIYPLLLIAGFLRLYRLDTSEFTGDQTMLFRMAYDAVHMGMLPATGLIGSIGNMNPPLSIYLYMIPAFFSADPYWATVFTALFTVVAVLITYIFTRRYYGRFAAIIAALLFATAETSVVFSRFMWQPNLLSPFVILFMFALFWGAVERRQGWFFPAILLLGVMYQLHNDTLLLAIPLVVVVLLAPKTIRLRDIVLAAVSLLLIFAPYLIWEVQSHLFDLHVYLNLAKQHTVIDDNALLFYERFLNGYYYDDGLLRGNIYDPIGIAHSVVFKLLPLLVLVRQILLFVLLAAGTTAVVRILQAMGRTQQPESGEVAAQKRSGVSAFLRGLWDAWNGLRSDHQACGLLLLLMWQIVPVVILSRHPNKMHLHYLLLVLPGQFILIAYFIAQVVAWIRMLEPAKGTASPANGGSAKATFLPGLSPALTKALRYTMFGAAMLIIAVQLTGSAAARIDMVNGINNHIFSYNDIGSLEHAVHEADVVAQAHHISRVYITLNKTDDFDSGMVGLPFLASQMHTPATLFDATNCFVLPGYSEGPAVLLTRNNELTPTLLDHFATTALIDQPPILGTTPFQLYIVTPNPQPTATPAGFAQHLQLLDTRAQFLGDIYPSLLATRWTLLNNEPAGPLYTYTYSMRAASVPPYQQIIYKDCLLTAIRAGDQLVTIFPFSLHSGLSPEFQISSQFLVNWPAPISLGPLRFETANSQTTRETLLTAEGQDTITLART